MTGTGTKGDPYIVDNWEEYASIAKTNNSVYAEFNPNAQNKVIDFNDIRPEGFSNSIAFAQYTNFNGWTLKNFHSTAKYAIKTHERSEISNLIFENFYFCPQEANAELIDCGSESGKMINCIISGQIQIQKPGTVNYYLFQTYLCQSSLNVIINAVGSVQIAYSITNSDIVLDVSAESVSLCPAKLINSRISGKIQSNANITAGNTASTYNVFNVQSNQPINYQGKGISVYNSDISASASTGDLVGCTAEQLRDAQYLYNLRFPIGVG